MDAAAIGEYMLVVSGPSGVGKTTLVRGLLERHPEAHLSVSYTTRAPRGLEKNGVAYHFVGRERFEAMVAEEQFAEWAEVHGHLYGTTRAVIEEAARASADLLFDVDYQGTAQLKALYPNAWSVLLAPPSLEVLEARLRQRGTDAEEVVARRMTKARLELSKAEHFDFVLVNEDLAAARASLEQVYATLHLRRRRAVRGNEELFGIAV